MSQRRDDVPFDPYHFEGLKQRGKKLSTEETFQRIYETNHWQGADSVSGAGASRRQTEHLETALPRLLASLGVETLIDAPCGDFGWMQNVDLPVQTYIGADIVPALIAESRYRYGNAHREFITLDLTADALPDADLMLCRDALVHLSFDDIFRVLANLRRSNIVYLLTTTFAEADENEDITTGDWRVLNLEEPPLHFPEPLHLINEHCTESEGQYQDKSLGLWRVAELPAF